MHDCPREPKIPAAMPALASVRSASSITMLADFPPSSRTTGTSRSAATAAIALPALTPPVKEIMSMPGCRTSAAEASAAPGMTLTSPGGKPASTHSLPSSSDTMGVTSEGLRITALPAASAGAIFSAARFTGEFHGVMAAATPHGS